MEVEDVNERVEWEARRVAAAFGVKEFICRQNPECVSCSAVFNDVPLSWMLNLPSGHLQLLEVGNGGNKCQLFLHADWSCPGLNHRSSSSLFKGLMARVLYHLGFEHRGVWSQHPPLSAHEQLELRLSLPREFWPQSWLEEEAGK